MDVAAGELERQASQGDRDAQFALGRRFEAADDARMARGWFARSAKQGNLAALRSLAINLLTRHPIVEHDGVNMIRSAAHKGDAEAAYVCAMLAAQDTGLENRWNVARECLGRAADLGWEPARAQLEFLQREIGPDLDDFVHPLELRTVFAAPRIAVVEGCASDSICDWMIEIARPRVSRALVYDSARGGGRIEEARNNSSIAFDITQSDIILMLLRARIAATAILPPVALEASAVLHYAPGQRFEPHVDYLDPAVPGYTGDVAENGQRVATFLLYLNEDYEGGETAFPTLGWQHKGRKGDALLFWNVDDTGEPDSRTLHAGLPPGSGEKWLLSQWLRRRPFKPEP